MQQSIGKRRLISKIWSLRQQTLQGMTGWQRAERTSELWNVFRRGMDARSPAELLQHVDTGPPVRRVHHQVQGPIRLEHSAKSGETRIRVGEVMQNSRTHDLIETHPKIVNSLDSDLVDL